MSDTDLHELGHHLRASRPCDHHSEQKKRKQAYRASAHGHSILVPRLQKVEQISHPKAFAFKIGRVGRSCFEEDPINALIRRGFGEHAAAMENVADVLSKKE
jgi:hypothetical protein